MSDVEINLPLKFNKAKLEEDVEMLLDEAKMNTTVPPIKLSDLV